MRLSCWFPVAAVVLVLAAAPPGHAQGIPDEATRDRVADWIERCDGNWSDACGLVDGYIVERMLGRWCRRLEVHWDTPRLVRSADVDHPAADVAARHRHRAQEFLEECVPIYAAALARAGTAASERADAGDTVPGATAGQREVEATGRTMQVRTRSNVRSGPGMAHDRVEVLDAGTEVRVIGTSGDWVEIVTPGGGNGFIYGPLLAEAAPDRVATASGEEPASSPDTVAEAAAIGAQDIPDAATRERVADWIERCKGGRFHDLGPDCQPVSDQIAASEHGQRCAQLRYSTPGLWGDHGLRMLRDPERALSAMAEHPGRRRKAEEFLRDCVPIYAAALDEAGAGDNLLLAEVTPDQGTAAVVGRDPADAPPSDNSGQACDAWEASYTVTWTEEGLQRGGINLTEVEAGFLTKAEAEDFVQSICSSRHSQYGPGAGVDYVLESCTVGEATCVQPRSHAQQPDPPGEAPGTDTPSVDVTSGSGPLHGSIAFSQEDDGAYAWGIAWSYDSSAGAESEAIGQCREYGGTQCAEAGWFQEACGALAIGSGNGHGTGWGVTTAEAERDALRQCRARLNDDCRIEVARCSRSEEAGGAGRTDDDIDAVAGRDPDDAPPSDNSGQACDAWEAYYTVTPGLKKGYNGEESTHTREDSGAPPRRPRRTVRRPAATATIWRMGRGRGFGLCSGILHRRRSDVRAAVSTAGGASPRGSRAGRRPAF